MSSGVTNNSKMYYPRVAKLCCCMKCNVKCYQDTLEMSAALLNIQLQHT